MTTKSIKSIEIEQQPSPEKLQQLGVESWPIWTKLVSNHKTSWDNRKQQIRQKK